MSLRCDMIICDSMILSVSVCIRGVPIIPCPNCDDRWQSLWRSLVWGSSDKEVVCTFFDFQSLQITTIDTVHVPIKKAISSLGKASKRYASNSTSITFSRRVTDSSLQHGYNAGDAPQVYSQGGCAEQALMAEESIGLSRGKIR